MGKKENKMGNKKNNKRNRNIAYTNKSHPEVEVTPEKNTRNFGKKIWTYLGYLALLISIIIARDPIINIFSSPKEKYEREAFVEGDLRPPKLTQIDTGKGYKISEVSPFYTNMVDEAYPKIRGIYMKGFNKRIQTGIVLGSEAILCFNDDLYKGIEISNPLMKGCTDFKISFGVKDSRLYISTEFKDLEKEETIGFIEYNHWKLYKPNLLYFENDDKRLEVRDKQNNIVFSISYQEVSDNSVGIVYIGGYFVNSASVLVLSAKPSFNECYSKSKGEWRQNAMDKIRTIKSVFP